LFSSCGGTHGGNPKTSLPVSLVIGPRSNALVSSLSICPQSVQFFDTSGRALVTSTLIQGDISLGVTDTALVSMSIPAGSYDHIEMSLSSTCDSMLSIQLTNLNGSYSTSDVVTARFAGGFTANAGSSLTVRLSMDPIIGQLAAASSNAQLKT